MRHLFLCLLASMLMGACQDDADDSSEGSDTGSTSKTGSSTESSNTTDDDPGTTATTASTEGTTTDKTGSDTGSTSGDTGTDGGDCDDMKGEEECNGIDDDCDGTPDNGCDDDEDGYCDATMTYDDTVGTPSCTPGDCDDSDPNVHPDQLETCNDQDDNCDGTGSMGANLVDEGCDDDEDGYCDAALGYELVDGKPPSICPASTTDENAMKGDDCDDSVSDGGDINPGQTEACNGFDDDCDGVGPNGFDEGCDLDGDGYCTETMQWTAGAQDVTCPNSTSNDDCDDGNGSVHPGAAEVCNGMDDNDCDTFADEDDVDADDWCGQFYGSGDQCEYNDTDERTCCTDVSGDCQN